MTEKILIDSDVTLDFLSGREEFREDSEMLFSLLDLKAVEGYSTSIMYANMHYILTKYNSKIKATYLLTELRKRIKILSVNEEHIDAALSSNLPDFEDAVQYYAAVENGINYIITRNKKDFTHSMIPVMNASEFIAYYRAVM